MSALSLPFLTPATLADGSPVALAVHEAKVPWRGNEHLVDVLASHKAAR